MSSSDHPVSDPSACETIARDEQQAIWAEACKLAVEITGRVTQGADLGVEMASEFRGMMLSIARLKRELRAAALLRERAEPPQPVNAKEALHAVKAMWTHWRLSLDRGAFSHSDGIQFLRMLDEYEANLQLPLTAPPERSES